MLKPGNRLVKRRGEVREIIKLKKFKIIRVPQLVSIIIGILVGRSLNVIIIVDRFCARDADYKIYNAL